MDKLFKKKNHTADFFNNSPPSCMYGMAIVGGIVGIPGTIGGRPGYDITMKPTLKEILHIST
jgi:hypothetical protein